MSNQLDIAYFLILYVGLRFEIDQVKFAPVLPGGEGNFRTTESWSDSTRLIAALEVLWHPKADFFRGL